jgi:hypothetical protein
MIKMTEQEAREFDRFLIWFVVGLVVVVAIQVVAFFAVVGR